MSEEEKMFSLRKIVRAELKQGKKIFWTTMARKMLADNDFNENILHKLDIRVH